jgi:hypothetical protein
VPDPLLPEPAEDAAPPATIGRGAAGAGDADGRSEEWAGAPVSEMSGAAVGWVPSVVRGAAVRPWPAQVPHGAWGALTWRDRRGAGVGVASRGAGAVRVIRRGSCGAGLGAAGGGLAGAWLRGLIGRVGAPLEVTGLAGAGDGGAGGVGATGAEVPCAGRCVAAGGCLVVGVARGEPAAGWVTVGGGVPIVVVVMGVMTAVTGATVVATVVVTGASACATGVMARVTGPTVLTTGATTGATALATVRVIGATALATVVVTGATALATGATALVTGATALATGATALTTGATALTTGAPFPVLPVAGAECPTTAPAVPVSVLAAPASVPLPSPIPPALAAAGSSPKRTTATASAASAPGIARRGDVLHVLTAPCLDQEAQACASKLPPGRAIAPQTAC